MQRFLDEPTVVKDEQSRMPSLLMNCGQKRLDSVLINGYDGEVLSSKTPSDLNQLVLYKHDSINRGQNRKGNRTSSIPNCSGSYGSSELFGTFTVQCNDCFKWRLMPTKEKYEEIREHLLEQPFVCHQAREWRPNVSCEDPADISQDDSRLWAIDKPSIAQPPSGWERLIRLRGEGGTRFADVYYVAPSGKKLRSMVEVEKYLFEHPEYFTQGVRLCQFSFQAPKPLRDDYVRKRPRKTFSPSVGNLDLTEPLEPSGVSPLSWAAPPKHELQPNRSSAMTPPQPSIGSRSSAMTPQPSIGSPSRAKKAKNRPSLEAMHGNPMLALEIKVEGTSQE